MRSVDVHPIIVAVYMAALLGCAIACYILAQQRWNSCCIPGDCDPHRVARAELAMPAIWGGEPVCQFTPAESSLMDCDVWRDIPPITLTKQSENEELKSRCFETGFAYWAMWSALAENLFAILLIFGHVRPVCLCIIDVTGCGSPDDRATLIYCVYMCVATLFYSVVLVQAVVQPFAVEDVSAKEAQTKFGQPAKVLAMWDDGSGVMGFFAVCLILRVIIPFRILLSVDKQGSCSSCAIVQWWSVHRGRSQSRSQPACPAEQAASGDDTTEQQEMLLLGIQNEETDFPKEEEEAPAKDQDEFLVASPSSLL